MHALLCQRVLAIPNKRFVPTSAPNGATFEPCTSERGPVEFLEPKEIDALVAAPDKATWTGSRDRALLLVAIQTGPRVSELIGLRRDSVVLGKGAHVRCEGKGRKTRCTPLRFEVMTMRCAHLSPDVKRAAVEALDGIYAKPFATVGQ